ncbi:hypothetical protein [Pseudomonas agarici]|uniref:hypothetical protein n=1 Tax=Pseudomonas agarici TaxID=46677 RepID=UPI00115FCEB1|nr:hypothetical protein [Pseudomonas agarici]NWB93032.1 hypothetical protein [Pseudomonas agarici]NWC09299.1 hypothetical protein [Pseudomonas agarici]
MTLLINGGSFLGFSQISTGGIARSIECRQWIARATEIMKGSMLRIGSPPEKRNQFLMRFV